MRRHNLKLNDNYFYINQPIIVKITKAANEFSIFSSVEVPPPVPGSIGSLGVV